MNAPAQTEGQSPAPEGDGFVLAAEPPVLDAVAEPAAPAPAADAAAPAAPAPAGDTTPPPDPASDDKPTESAAERQARASAMTLEKLAAVALDGADLANRGARAAASVAADLRKAQETVRKVQESAQKQAMILLISATILMVICMAFFLVTGIRMNSRINQLDLTIEAVMKRVVDLNAGVGALDETKDSVSKLSKEVEALAKASADVNAKLEATARQTETLTAQIPSRTAQQVASSAQGVSRQVDALGARLQTQANAVQALSRDVQALKGTVGNVDKLNRDVQALVTLQRERYLETVQRNPAPAAAASTPRATSQQLPGTAAAARPAEREVPTGAVQYPRPQPSASPNAQPGAR